MATQLLRPVVWLIAARFKPRIFRVQSQSKINQHNTSTNDYIMSAGWKTLYIQKNSLTTSRKPKTWTTNNVIIDYTDVHCCVTMSHKIILDFIEMFAMVIVLSLMVYIKPCNNYGCVIIIFTRYYYEYNFSLYATCILWMSATTN